MHRILALVTGVTILLLSGCTSRGLTVTSEPPGAEVSINHRVVGQTPMRVGFTHYGTYRIELRKRNYDTLVREEKIKPTAYGYDPAAFVADNIIPARLNDEVYLHYVMKPLEQKSERASLLERAELARAGQITHPKTGEQIAIDLGREPTKIRPDDEAEDAAPPGEIAEVPPNAGGPAPSAPMPEGLTIAESYGLTATPTKQPKQPAGTFVKDEERKHSGPIRIPKDEELFYEQSAPEGEPDKTAPQKKSSAK